MLLYTLLSLITIITIICVKKILSLFGSDNIHTVHNHRSIIRHSRPNTDYELMIIDDDMLNKLYLKREIYTISERQPPGDFVVFVNVGNTTIITTKLSHCKQYSSLEEIRNMANIDAVDCGPKLSQYYLCKYMIINADINRELVNGVFHHYIIDHDLILPEK